MIDGQKLWLCDLLSGKSCKEMEIYLLDKSLVDRIERCFCKFVVLGANVHLSDLWLKPLGIGRQDMHVAT